MNDKDKEAFEQWWEEYVKGDLGLNIKAIPDKKIEKAWQSACEYKQKEIDEIKLKLDAAEIAYKSNQKVALMSAILNDKNKELAQRIEKLQAENAKLKECLKEIANEDFRGNRSRGSVKAYLCLKELDENL